MGLLACAFGAIIAFLIIAACILVASVTQLSPIEMGLKYNYILETVDPKPYTTNGLYVLPFATLKRFPKTIQTLQFDDADILDGRTSDGLPLILGASFQYRLDPMNLYLLYHRFGEDYLRIYRRVAAHLVTEQATKFTAYQFFNEKQAIATQMRAVLDEYFQKHLFALVESFQINEDDLPPAFYNAVLQAATTKQNITKMEKVLQAKQVTLSTRLLQAASRANQTVTLALGTAAQIQQEGSARAAIEAAYIDADATGYGKVREALGLDGPGLLNYIWNDVLGSGGAASAGGGGIAKQLIVGGSGAATFVNSN
ncbi:unnamed protein product [Amoebophrya sp. A120]|nr:unnamed protein product [Amoebophrya sp. A120]|eukprot:GSA120T00017754001.1